VCCKIFLHKKRFIFLFFKCIFLLTDSFCGILTAHVSRSLSTTYDGAAGPRS
jgi:hypothetical protein